MNELDSGTITRLRGIYPGVADRVPLVYAAFFEKHGLWLRCTQGMRDTDHQKELFSRGRDAEGRVIDRKLIVTNSRPGTSMHEFGFAIDSCFVGADPFLETLAVKDPGKAFFLWQEYGRLAKLHGLAYGGDWSTIVDRPHIQDTYGMKLSEIILLFKQGGLPALWTKADQTRGVPIGQGWAS